LAQTDASTLLVCGTNSFNPKCRTYTTIKEVFNSNPTPNNKTDTAAASNGTTTTKSTTTKPQLIDDGKFSMKHEFSGKGFCPHDPKHNSTAIFTGM
jgi:hypothetical protein